MACAVTASATARPHRPQPQLGSAAPASATARLGRTCLSHSSTRPHLPQRRFAGRLSGPGLGSARRSGQTPASLYRPALQWTRLPAPSSDLDGVLSASHHLSTSTTWLLDSPDPRRARVYTSCDLHSLVCTARAVRRTAHGTRRVVRLVLASCAAPWRDGVSSAASSSASTLRTTVPAPFTPGACFTDLVRASFPAPTRHRTTSATPALAICYRRRPRTVPRWRPFFDRIVL